MRVLSYYWYKAPWVLVYMLQQVEYDPAKLYDWVKTVPALTLVIKRKELILTKRAKLTVLLCYCSWLTTLFFALFVVYHERYLLAVFLILLSPISYVMTCINASLLLQILIVNPKEQAEIRSARAKLDASKAIKIAILGSYGKTSMKEMLITVLTKDRRAKATPGNMNVLVSHARWINKELDGSEEILVFELGEGKPGDIDSFANYIQPDCALITGLAPNHLDHYPNLQSVVSDFLAIQGYVDSQNVYVNQVASESVTIPRAHVYGLKGCNGWTAKDIKISVNKLEFEAHHNKETMKVHTALIGRHHVGPLLTVIAVASRLGLSNKHIEEGLSDIQAYEHRMKPIFLNGAWIIDDTYNGNLEGLRVGLDLLHELRADRKWYVTPGLVDQGEETEKVHVEVGELIARSNPDIVVLMQNSVTEFIKAGLKNGVYRGEIRIEPDPLAFYTNLEHRIAKGDIVLMQNDWTDNYV